MCLGQIAGSLIGGYFAGKVGHSKVLVTSCSSLVSVTFVALSMTSSVVALIYTSFV